MSLFPRDGEMHPMHPDILEPSEDNPLFDKFDLELQGTLDKEDVASKVERTRQKIRGVERDAK